MMPWPLHSHFGEGATDHFSRLTNDVALNYRRRWPVKRSHPPTLSPPSLWRINSPSLGLLLSSGAVHWLGNDPDDRKKSRETWVMVLVL